MASSGAAMAYAAARRFLRATSVSSNIDAQQKITLIGEKRRSGNKTAHNPHQAKPA